ncbi:MAG: hypothetical protein L0332_11775 [Chloroflexi bacterium]|nr:hypothetical protein [Chloroflexota bacterium]MCI0580186.1 hypothetical protein [Chloroflexota bacterium]MCI0646046.1 hypothetical protein [Chloroflexota bacterium]MCI0727388.1 hypothetical protein [Chloroflexota bacterium]
MTAVEWIDRYVHEIGQHLPAKMRADVQMELHSLLMDALEQRATAGQREPDEEMVLELLREFGQPEKVAMRYIPSRPLIGAELYPYFIAVLTVVLALNVAVYLLALLAGLVWRQPDNVAALVWETLANLIQTFLMNLGLVGLIFAILERVLPEKGEKASDWNPRSLPAITDPGRINRTSLVGGVIFNLIMIVILNFFPQWIGLVDLAGEEWGIVPLLAPEFAVHIPWLTALWGLEAALKLVVVSQRRWQRPARWAEFGLSLLAVFVLYRLITGGPLLIVPALTALIKVVLGLVLVIGSLEALGQLYRLLTRRPFVPWRVVNGRLLSR